MRNDLCKRYRSFRRRNPPQGQLTKFRNRCGLRRRSLPGLLAYGNALSTTRATRLVFHYVRIVRELEPKYCVFENVRGLTLGKHADFLRRVGIGSGRCRLRCAAPVSGAQCRRFRGAAGSSPVVPGGCTSWAPTTHSPERNSCCRTTVWDAIGDLPDADCFDELNVTDEVRTDWTTEALYARRLRALDVIPIDYGYRREFDPGSTHFEPSHQTYNKFASTLSGHRTWQNSNQSAISANYPPVGFAILCAPGTDSARGAFTSPRPIHPYLPRVITVREAARLHSYPDWFRFHATKWHGFRQIGNSVPPLLARAVANEIIKVLGVVPSAPTRLLRTGDPELLSLDMGGAARYFHVPRNTIAQRTRQSDPKQQTLWGENMPDKRKRKTA